MDAHNDAPIELDGRGTSRRPALVYLFAVVLGLALFGLLLTHTLPRAIANHNPTLVLRFFEDPVALFAVAERTYDDARSAVPPTADPMPQGENRLRAMEQQFARLLPTQSATTLPDHVRTKIKGQVLRSLQIEPLQAPALRLLGQIYADEGDIEKAAELMKAALSVSARETKAAYWLLRKAFDAGDFQEAVRLCDLMLRTRYVGVPENVYPVLARILENDRGREHVVELLKSRPTPPWAPRFLTSLPRYIQNARTPLELMIALRDTPAAPSDEQIGAYMDVLIQNRFFELAYYTWLQRLTAPQLENLTTPFNGSFEDPNLRGPFTWKLGSGPGASSAIVADPTRPKQKMLLVSFDQGRVTFPGVSQLQMLPPGRYQFSAKYKVDLRGPRGLVWRLSCMDQTRKRLGQTEMHLNRKSEWTNTEFKFSVQGGDCAAQILELLLDARSASEQLVTGWVSYDDLQIKRLPEHE